MATRIINYKYGKKENSIFKKRHKEFSKKLVRSWKKFSRKNYPSYNFKANK